MAQYFNWFIERNTCSKKRINEYDWPFKLIDTLSVGYF